MGEYEQMNDFENMQLIIAAECDEVKEMLLEKNRKYGNSAFNPLRLFSKADPIEQIRVRLDDKFSRLLNMPEDENEDVIKDIIGYLVIYQIKLKELENDSVRQSR